MKKKQNTFWLASLSWFSRLLSFSLCWANSSSSSLMRSLSDAIILDWTVSWRWKLSNLLISELLLLFSTLKLSICASSWDCNWFSLLLFASVCSFAFNDCLSIWSFNFKFSIIKTIFFYFYFILNFFCLTSFILISRLVLADSKLLWSWDHLFCSRSSWCCLAFSSSLNVLISSSCKLLDLVNDSSSSLIRCFNEPWFFISSLSCSLNCSIWLCKLALMVFSVCRSDWSLSRPALDRSAFFLASNKSDSFCFSDASSDDDTF